MNQLSTPFPTNDPRNINEDNEEIPEWVRPYIRELKAGYKPATPDPGLDLHAEWLAEFEQFKGQTLTSYGWFVAGYHRALRAAPAPSPEPDAAVGDLGELVEEWQGLLDSATPSSGLFGRSGIVVNEGALIGVRAAIDALIAKHKAVQP